MLMPRMVRTTSLPTAIPSFVFQYYSILQCGNIGVMPPLPSIQGRTWEERKPLPCFLMVFTRNNNGLIGVLLVGAGVQHFLRHGGGKLRRDAGGNERLVDNQREGGHFFASLQLVDNVSRIACLQRGCTLRCSGSRRPACTGVRRASHRRR